jgi:hypothetical protein
MKTANPYCRRKWKILVSAIFISISVFSQQKDSVAIGTVIAPAVDSAANLEQQSDSATANKYNYYISLSQWGKEDSVQFRAIPDSAINKMRSDDAFWYANKEFKKVNQQPGQNSFWRWLAIQKWYKTLTWIVIIGGFMAVLFAYLANSDTGIFRRRSKTIVQANDEDGHENIFSINYPVEIEKAVSAGNYRIGIRLLFLRLLKTLSENQLIRYKEGGTNQDYLRQLRDKDFYKDFFRLTRNYEYTWYGHFDLNRELFTSIRNDFENFDRIIKG